MATSSTQKVGPRKLPCHSPFYIVTHDQLQTWSILNAGRLVYGCQCIAQTSLTHWVQSNILYLQFTHFTCTAHIPSLYKAFYCTLLHTHQYTDYSVFLSHFILLTWYQSHSFDVLVPIDIFGVLSLPSPSSSSYCQKRVIQSH